jgi:hypothetical protein
MRTHRWKPEEISEAISLSHHYTIPQIARTMKKRPSVVRSLIQRMNPKYTKLQDIALTLAKVGAMLGVTHGAISDYIERGYLDADIVGKRRSGFGTRRSVDWESLYALANTPTALEWKITDAMPPDLAAIVMETHRQWMHVDDLIAAAPLCFAVHRPWNNREVRVSPIMYRGNATYYLKSSLYEVMYQRYVKNINRRAIKASWLLAIHDAWHGTHITSKALLAHGVSQYYMSMASPVQRGVFRRKDIVAVLRRYNFDALAKQILGTEVHYLELMAKEDLP